MPLGFERLNERTQRPNEFINFLKPWPKSSPDDQAIAKDFLERIAAQCYPIMKKNYISVMALEEYPPNPEFLGRNFNAGEAIQLVLKDKAGRWLSFKFVQMVMMHELAHCKQMNHSRAFWQVRNQYADHMKELWVGKYVGEGLWGRGQNLTSGNFVHDHMPDNADVPEHLCGGTYRTARGRKRKRGQDSANKPKVSYAERQQKRIAKKFGVHGEGQGLGEDELVRGALEQGKRGQGKPRVAGSKRGRELRANAALARFEAAKKQATPEKTPELEDDDDDSETESDEEYGDGLPIFDTLGRIKDQRGRDLYKVCGDEGEQNDGGQNEMDELRIIGEGGQSDLKVRNETSKPAVKEQAVGAPILTLGDDSETESEQDTEAQTVAMKVHGNSVRCNSATSHENADSDKHAPPTPAAEASSISATTNTTDSTTNLSICPICSLENDPDSPTCVACSHVLKTSLMPYHWRCKGPECKTSKYINAGDTGRCGLCGAQKPAEIQRIQRTMGVTRADLLRWD